MYTSLCERLGLEVPIIQAAMGGASCPALAAAVSNAGGLGMLALSWSNIDAVRDQIRQTRALTDRPFGANLVLQWPQDERLKVCLDEGVPVISFFWGDPAPLVDRVHARGGKVLHTVARAEEARRAVESGVDVLVAQGWEAGGHVWSEVAALPLVPAVVDAVKPAPVAAAGGIADGRGLAAALSLGAAGAWIGTRFLGAEEAAIHPRYRAMLLAAKETDTHYGDLFNVGWPNARHRVLRNKTVAAWEAAGRPPSGARPGEGEVIGASRSRGEIVRYRSATPATDCEGDIEAMSLWAGQGVNLLTRVQPAAAIIEEIVTEAAAALRQASAAAAASAPSPARRARRHALAIPHARLLS